MILEYLNIGSLNYYIKLKHLLKTKYKLPAGIMQKTQKSHLTLTFYLRP